MAYRSVDMSSQYYDPEMDFNMEHAFMDKAVRRGFIRKVYTILMAQLAITCAFICIFLYVESVRVYAQNNIWLVIVAVVLSLVLCIALSCCESVRRNYPQNFICLFLFTICEGFMLGIIAGTSDQESVLMAVGICTVVCLGLTIFAFQTKYDFTMMGAGLFVALVILLIFGIFAAIFRSKVMNLLYGSAGALVFSLYLVYDTQVMLGGNHKYSISPEEYIFAALSLYLDIVNLFLYILRIVQAARN